jgi:hypothetical protein
MEDWEEICIGVYRMKVDGSLWIALNEKQTTYIRYEGDDVRLIWADELGRDVIEVKNYSR